MVRRFRFGKCEVVSDYATGYTVTIFPDGAVCPARPENDAAYYATAERLGFGSDTSALSREHEIAHSVLMTKMGFLFSPTLYAVSHPGKPGVSRAFQHIEEDMVCAFQWMLNAPKESIVGLPEPWVTWRYEFLCLLRG